LEDFFNSLLDHEYPIPQREPLIGIVRNRPGRQLAVTGLSLTVCRRAPKGLFKVFNMPCQYLPKGRMVSFDDFRKLLVNGVALRSNSLVRLLTSEQL
jgi:hypothetical protein